MNNKNKETELPNWLKQFTVKSTDKKPIDNGRSVIYNRCSTEKQDSLDWQDRVCVNLCSQNKFDIIKTFGAKESATTDDRKVFKEMLKFCKENNIGNIVVYAYDRFTRSGDISLLKSLREKGIKVHAATQSVDDQTPSGRFSQGLYLMFAEMENEQRRDRILEGQRKKLRNGEWIGKPTIGYIKDYVTGKKEHERDKPQCLIGPNGNLIKQAFLWKCNENLTHEAIIRRLIPMGLTLLPAQLSRIFRNPFYCGYISQKLLDDREVIRGKHEPLISEEVFLAVNGILNGNRQGYKKVSHADKMPFKASVKCGKCERPLTAYLKKNKYIYYKCPNKGCCVNVSEIKLLNLFESELAIFAIDSRLLPEIKNKLESTYWMLHNADTARIKPMKEELTRLKNDLEKMEFSLATGNITLDLFGRVSSAHQQKIRTIEEELQTQGRDTSNLDKLLDSTLEIACNLLKMWQISNYEGKVRLQKLVFPDGLEYVPENHALRTISINLIFLEITSISNNLTRETSKAQVAESEILRQLYLMFGSSNFLWEKLDKTALVLKEIQQNEFMVRKSLQKPVITTTGSTLSTGYIFTSNDTRTETSPKNPIQFLKGINTGSTNCLLSFGKS